MHLERVSPRRPGLLLPARLDPTGREGPTRAQAAGPRWRRVSRGRYLPADHPASLEQRIVDAGVLLPALGGVTGWAALRWFGATWFDGTGTDGRQLPVDLTTGPKDIRSQPGFLVNAEHFGPWDLVEHDGLWLTTPARSALFAVRHAADLVEATVAIDMACQGDVVSLAEASAYAALLGTWTGIPQARQALGLADEDSWSPAETRLRMLWVLQASCPRPLCNVPVFDRTGRHLGTPDLLDPVAGVVGEYDGQLHLESSRRRVDVSRETAFRGVGLETVTVVTGEMRAPGRVAGRIVAAYDRALWLPEARRAWTITPPASWRAPRGVVERRSRRAARHVQHLARSS